MKRVDRSAARAEAASELASLGFLETGGTWQRETASLKLTAELPPRFPYQLPTLRVDRATFKQVVPHVDATGKVCVAHENGLLLDATRPRALVRAAVERANEILERGARGETRADLYDEFGAYWGGKRELLSLCVPDESARPVKLARVEEKSYGARYVVADKGSDLRRFAARVGLRFQKITPAFYVPLTKPVDPPMFREELTIGFARKLFEEGAGAATWTEAAKWLGDAENLTLILSFALDAERGRVLFALRAREELIGSSNGFRAGHLPFPLALQRYSSSAAARLSVTRADGLYLRERTGNFLDLSGKRVVVVGCGALGSHVSVMLAEAGVGFLTLIDPEDLNAENAMRHVLGMTHVGKRKVEALRAHIQAKLPSVEVRAIGESVDDALARERGMFAAADVVVLATGDHTLELAISETARREVRLVHAWVEAQGVGGHVLVDGKDSVGCLACLYESDEQFGLVCRASFCAPGQVFTRTLAGCAGVFTPFGAMDAQRAAIEAARATIDALSGRIVKSALISWLESTAAFDEGRLEPSARVQLMQAGVRVSTDEHAKGCARCQ